MAYTKTTWAADVALTVARLNNLETQYDEAMTLFTGHNHDSVHYTKTESDTRFWHEGNDGAGSGMDADLLYYAGGNKHAADFAAVGVPAGLIIGWPEATDPPGWQEANGTNGTRDLRGRFIVCAGVGSGYNVGDVGGAASRTPSAASVTIGNCTLTIAQIKHAHSLTDRQLTSGAPNYGGTGQSATAGSATVQTGVAGGGGAHNHPGSFAGNSFDNRPPFIVLKWIQKL